MRILITNNTLAVRAGSELFVRDLAMALVRRGHDPMVFSTVLGDVADELRRATIPVLDDLRDLKVVPDVIHGQHHLDAMAAFLRFPDVPAVLVCHGWLPWEEAPVSFPSILRYVAVDDLCRERLLAEGGIPPKKIQVIRNFVDLERFRRRPPLPARPPVGTGVQQLRPGRRILRGDPPGLQGLRHRAGGPGREGLRQGLLRPRAAPGGIRPGVRQGALCARGHGHRVCRGRGGLRGPRGAW